MKQKWSKMAPNQKERSRMLKKCGRKCFLGTKKSFPICSKNTCKINNKGVHAAYVRAREYMSIKPQTQKYQNIARKAKRLLTSRRRTN